MTGSQQVNPQWQRAIHEAGHAVAALAKGIKILSLSLEQGISSRGNRIDSFCLIDYQSMEGKFRPDDVCKRKITVAYAGATAQALFFDESPIEVFCEQRDDQENVRKSVDDLRDLRVSESDVWKCRKEAWEEAICLVEERRSVIRAIAQAANQKQTLKGPEIEDIARSVDPTVFQNG